MGFILYLMIKYIIIVLIYLITFGNLFCQPNQNYISQLDGLHYAKELNSFVDQSALESVHWNYQSAPGVQQNQTASCAGDNNNQLFSPNGHQQLSINNINGTLQYTLVSWGDTVVKDSKLGFYIDKSFQIQDSEKSSYDETWEPVYGQFNKIRNHYNQVKYSLVEASGIKMNLYARAFNDGVAFRYEFPEQQLDSIDLIDYTSFAFTNDHTIWYKEQHDKWNEPGEITITDKHAYGSPVTVKVHDSLYASVRQANLQNCSKAFLLRRGAYNLKYQITKDKKPTPYTSPWRSLTAVKKPGDLVESNLVLNLNDPPKGDFSWVKPGNAFWDWRVRGGKVGGYHYCTDDITTECCKHYIDKAAEMGVEYFTIDANWYGNEFKVSSNPFTDKPKFDVKEVIKYGNSKNVGIWLYINEVALRNYDKAKLLKTYHEWGAVGIKHGFLKGKGAERVQHAQKVLALCAENKLLYVQHEGFHAAGIQRTFPNYFGVELGYAQLDGKIREQINHLPEPLLKEKSKNPDGKYSDRIVPPSYHTISPFTTLLSGPKDFTPGVFDCNDGFLQGRLHFNSPLPSTINNQLAICNIYHSGVLHLMDAPESYEKYPKMFEFIKNLPRSVDETRVLNAKIGDYFVIARRKGNEWFISGVSDEQARELTISFDFLGNGTYSGKYYADDPECSYLGEKEKFHIKNINSIDQSSKYPVKMVPGGGFNIWLNKIQE